MSRHREIELVIAKLPPSWNECEVELFDVAQLIIVPREEHDDDMIPFCWDAVLVVDEKNPDTIQIIGCVGCCGYGDVEIRVPRSGADRLYRLYIDTFRDSEYDDAIHALRSHDCHSAIKQGDDT